MSQVFVAQIVILEHKSIICAGYNAVLHIHTVVEEVQIMVRYLEGVLGLRGMSSTATTFPRISRDSWDNWCSPGSL